MADLQVVSRFMLIFTFILFHAILTSEGRSLKSPWKDELQSVNKKNGMHEHESQFLVLSQSPRCDDCLDAGKKNVPSPTPHDQVADSGKSEAVYKDDFHPANRRNSLKVGHSVVGLKKDAIRPKAPSSHEEWITVTGTLGNVESTTPGHSPGVGHV